MTLWVDWGKKRESGDWSSPAIRHLMALAAAASVAKELFRVAFSRFYIDTALHRAPKYDVLGEEQFLRRTGCVFFIPEKYRVYKEYISDGRALPQPQRSLLALKAFYEPHGVPVVDLTPVLSAAARSLLAQDQYVFWRDDSHWNGNGMRAVAPVVASLPSGPSSSGRTIEIRRRLASERCTLRRVRPDPVLSRMLRELMIDIAPGARQLEASVKPVGGYFLGSNRLFGIVLVAACGIVYGIGC